MTTQLPSRERVSDQQISDLISRLTLLMDGYPDLTVQAEKLTVAALLELQQTRALLAAYEQEPVAWRYRFVHSPASLEHGSPFTTEWVMTRSEDECNQSDCFERQPLYTHPAPSIPAAVPDFKKLAAELVENLVDCDAADDSAISQYTKWAEKTCRAAMFESPVNGTKNAQ